MVFLIILTPIYQKLPYDKAAFPNKKAGSPYSGNPAIFFKIRSFPSPLHNGFGIFFCNITYSWNGRAVKGYFVGE
jgi:hypothetical protein